MISWLESDARWVRAHIASVWLGDATSPARIGAVTLRDHQRDAAGRLRRTLARFGGVLLADDVGLGKTYTAIAATEAFGRLLVVAPASLRYMWRQALRRTNRSADFVSFESLSRPVPARHARRFGDQTAVSYDVAIIDEAHHARNPATRRYQRLASITAGCRVLLLSATPVHNATSDLHALLALFLGSRAERLTPRDLAECIVRRTRSDVPVATPARAPPTWLELPSNAGHLAVLDALLEIPPGCPPRDGANANALVTLGLVRAWSSTDAALRALLRRRLARSDALRDAVVAGRHPTRAELQAWVVGDDATQLAFPELIVPESATASGSELLAAVEAHMAGVRTALRIVSQVVSADDARADLLRGVRARHSGQPIVVFSHYAESVQALFRRLSRDGGVAAVTARGATVAGGRLHRDEALARFAPRALGAQPPRGADAITLLITTDLLSEGINLQDAAAVVHVDLPWTPARLAQRMGRVWRIGSRHTNVFEYAIAPPASATRVSGIIERLEAKAFAARRLVGHDLTPLIPPKAAAHGDAKADSGPHVESLPRAVEMVRRSVSAWRDGSTHVRRQSSSVGSEARAAPHALLAAVHAPMNGWLAVVETPSGAWLAAKESDGAVTADVRSLLPLVRAASGAPCPIPAAAEQAKRDVLGYVDALTAARDAGLDAGSSSPHARLSARIGQVVVAAPAHRRSTVAKLAAAARDAVAQSRGAGAERALSLLLSELRVGESPDARERWLARVARFAGELPVSPAPDATGAGHPCVSALLLLVAPEV